jgi:DNA repair exonuclease SbcCD ATPase subunit
MIILRRLAVAQYKGIRGLDLVFPERGSFLIEGRNEAGKSTLFDAVYYALYGVPMVGDLAASLHYGAEQMEVRLELTVGGTQLSVWRRTRQTAKTLRSEAELTVLTPAPGALPADEAGERETVKGTSPVTQRLQLELGGLTAEALLNSCLVAQKQLGRLETLSRASREEALTVLLNLGKLTDVQNRLKLRAQDEEGLRAVRARVSLARAGAALDVLAAERDVLEHRRRLISIRDGLTQLDGLHDSGRATDAALTHDRERLASRRATLVRVDALKGARARWQRVEGLAVQGVAARREQEASATRVAEAHRAAGRLPVVRGALQRYLQAREEADALAGRHSRRRELDLEARRIAERLAEREREAARETRLTAELDHLRRERRKVAAQLNQLAPLVAEQDRIGATLTALQALTEGGRALDDQRRALEELEEQAVRRAEADARHREAEQGLVAAREALTAAEALRHRRAVVQALAGWREARLAATAAERGRRLLDDLALAVAGVEHVAVEHEGETAGLRLSLLVDHPLTGAQVVRLRLWAGGAELTEARPATATEATGLQAGNLPSLGAGADGATFAALEGAGEALLALGEPIPSDAAAAAARLAAIAGARPRAALPEFGEPGPQTVPGVPGEPVAEDFGDDPDAGYLQARAGVIAAEGRLAEAQAARVGLPEVAALQRRLVVAQRHLADAEAACLQNARSLGLPAVDLETALGAVPQAVVDGQRRFRDLVEQTGQRVGLQAQLHDQDRTGREWLRQLEECRANVAADDAVDLQARLASLDVERDTIEEEAGRLYTSILDVLGDRDEDHHGRSAAEGGAAKLTTLTMVAAGASESGLAVAVADVRETRPAVPVPVAALRQRLQQRCDALQGEVAVLERQAATLDEAEAILTAAGERLAGLDADLAASLRDAEGAGEAGSARGQPSLDGHLDLPAVAIALAGQRLASIDADLAALDEPAVRTDEQAAQRAVWAAEDRREKVIAEGQRLAATLLDLAREAGIDLPARDEADPRGGAGGDGALLDTLDALPAVAQRLRQAWPQTAGPLPALDEIVRDIQALQQREWELTRATQDARLLLGDEAPLAPDVAERLLAEVELDLSARRRAQDILGQTRQRMINKVLPDTMRNMCLLLPLLTAGRYRYAELTPDYRLQVWDERKHGYVEKSLYSGGTQDQFSLALRLGFALAALPRELGTSPGFLFLDEPLSSFDHDRTAALIDLLTHGQVATFFQQVFLISHSRAFDPGRFSHHLVMEEGGVVQSTLAS